MLGAALTLLLSLDGGAMMPAPWEGDLEPGHRYELRGPGQTLLDALRPPRLKLPRHHAGRVEWVGGAPTLPEGEVALVFEVISHDVVRMAERRWNSTWVCRVLSVTPR